MQEMIFRYFYLIFFLMHSHLSGELAGPQAPYRLQCGDRLYISVYGDIPTKRVVLVDPSGNVNYLLAKNVPARGATIASLREELTHRLSSYYRDPMLMITLINTLGEYYAIIGEVREPGYKKIEGNPTLLTALCEAKGFTTRLFRDQTVDQADLEKSFMVRDGEYLPINFLSLVEEGDISQDILLKNGDYIYISPRGLKKIYVLGEVTSPTVIEFLNGVTLSQIIAEAGGVTTSASSRVAIIRGSLTLPIRFLVDINRIVKGKAMDFPLEPGDIVYVPPMRFSALKEIVKMGIANFVSVVASAAGVATYVSIQPAAAATGSEIVAQTAAAVTTQIVPVVP